MPPDAPITADELKRQGWTLRGYTDREDRIFRLDLPERSHCWCEVIEAAAGWRGFHVKLGMHCPYGSLVTVADLDRFVSLAKAGKL